MIATKNQIAEKALFHFEYMPIRIIRTRMALLITPSNLTNSMIGQRFLLFLPGRLLTNRPLRMAKHACEFGKVCENLASRAYVLPTYTGKPSGIIVGSFVFFTHA